MKSTPEGSRLSKFKLVELYNESIMSNFDDVDLYNNIWSVVECSNDHEKVGRSGENSRSDQ